MSALHKKVKSSQILVRLIRDYLIPHKAQIGFAVFFMIITASCSAITVRLLQPTIDEVFLTKNRHMLILIPLLMLGIYILKGIAEFYQNYTIKYIGQQVLTKLQMQMYEHLLFADLAFIESQSSGRLISRFTNDIILMRGAVSNMLVGCAKYFLLVLFLIIIMFNLEPVLSCIVFFAFPVAIYPIQRIGRKMRMVCAEAQEELSNYTAKLDETFYSIKIIKSFSAEKTEAKRAGRIAAKILEFYQKGARLDALTSPIMEILTGTTIAGMLWYGGYMIMKGETTLGALIAFIAAFVSSYRPFKSLVSLNVSLQEGIEAAGRVFNLLDTKPVIKNNPEAKTPIFTYPQISFKNIHLNFGLKPALVNFNLHLEQGKTYAFVGRSGSGKTSLANLLVRFYDPDQGEIVIDSYNIKDIAINHLRKQIALVTQDTILFDDSVAHNISYAYPAASDEEIITAAKAADADEFIHLLPQGYDTIIGTAGSSLSGGEKQKLSIARAFLKNAPILILDEATSALDADSEHSIINSIADLRKGRTTLIITHRLNSIVNVDRIIVMKHGNIAEQGTHLELLKNHGEYYKLYNKQLKEAYEVV